MSMSISPIRDVDVDVSNSPLDKMTDAPFLAVYEKYGFESSGGYDHVTHFAPSGAMKTAKWTVRDGATGKNVVCTVSCTDSGTWTTHQVAEMLFDDGITTRLATMSF
jgi:hypothetical protein